MIAHPANRTDPREDKPHGPSAQAGKRRAQFAQTITDNQRDIAKIYAEYAARNSCHYGGPVGAIYARFSTEFQSSVADQVRALLLEAEKRGIFVPRESIFADYGVSGRKKSRPALDQLRQALREGRVKVLMVLSLSRLFRNQRGCLEFIEDEIVGNGARCIVLDKGIDTEDRDRWQMILSFSAMFDEFSATAHRTNIRAAHVGLASHGNLWGSIPVGYTATDDQGNRCEVRIDTVGAEYIRKIFSWFVIDGLSIDAIARRLNSDPACPIPPMSDGRWTRQIVRRVLQNPRYRGEWAYGRTERRWSNKRDYARVIMRPEPMHTAQDESLRIVSDEQFYAAESRLLSNVGDRGRRTSAGARHPITFLLQGLLWCAHHQRKMYRAGPNGDVYYVCTHCQTTDVAERPLFTLLDGETVVRRLVEELGKLLPGDDALVSQIIFACQEAEKRQQRPDSSKLAQLESQIARLQTRISSVLRNMGDSEQETRESEAALRELRAERATLQAELGALRDAANRTIQIPTRDEVVTQLQGIVNQLNLVLRGEPPDVEALCLAKQILRRFTGGRIELTQQGERRQFHGWLRGTFFVDLIDVLASDFRGASGATTGGGAPFQIDFTRPCENEELAKKIIELRRKRLTLKAIAKELKICRNRTSRLLRRYASQFAPELMVQKGRKYVQRMRSDPPSYVKISPDVRAHYESGLRIREIAKLLKLDRTTVTKALRHAYVSQGEDPPDTRKRS